MPQYPTHIRTGTGQTTLFERRSDLYSIRHPQGDSATDAIAVMHGDAKATFAVHQGVPRHDHAAKDVGPVYSAGPDGPLAVPTGQVLVRLTDGIRPEQRRDQFEAAGFDIDRTLSYAPSAAWLRPTTGGVAQALRHLDALAKVPDVVHIEPQLLMERSLK